MALEPLPEICAREIPDKTFMIADFGAAEAALPLCCSCRRRNCVRVADVPADLPPPHIAWLP
jgi:hypothetical protein